MTGVDRFTEDSWDAERVDTAFAVAREDVANALVFAAGLVRSLDGFPPEIVEVNKRRRVSLQTGRKSSAASVAEALFGHLPEPEFYSSIVSYRGEIDGYKVQVYGAASAKDRARLLRAELAELEEETGVA